MSKLKKGTLIALFALVALLFVVFVWPTPYRIYSISGAIMRVNRFTYTVEIFIPSEGWVCYPQRR
jgi:hypothetical protein